MPNTNLNVIFFGSSEYCLPVVNALNKNFNLSAVISKSKSVPTILFAEKKKIKVFTPQNVAQLLELKSILSFLQPDLAVVADYGLIIPQKIFQIPKFQTINIHFSLLPLYRGPSPVQYSILFGEKKASISLQKMEQEVDSGDILWQKEEILLGQETTPVLYKKLFQIASLHLPNLLKSYVQNGLDAKKQDDRRASYTRLISRNDGYLPWEILINTLNGIVSRLKDYSRIGLLSEALEKSNNIAQTIERAVRAFTPWPGVWTEIKIKNQKSKIKNQKRLKVLKSYLKDNKLIPDLVQLEGKKPVSWKQFLEGYPQIERQIKQ